VCAKCGGIAKVPFKPNGRKDVFCSKCFGEMNGEEPRGGNRFESRGSDRGFNDRPRYDKPMFNAICDECGDNCQVPFEPRNGNPVLCSNCFAKKDGRGNDSRSFSPKTSGSVDLSEINAKLDKIIKMLSPETPKDITEKILKTIEETSGKEVVPAKKKAKTAKKKVSKAA
jgi:CxxC-x17-CxxC domain-containing protein